MGFEVVKKATWNKTLEQCLLFNEERDAAYHKLSSYEPQRSTKYSAGYDFKMPFGITCQPGKKYKIPTGFKWCPYDVTIDIRRRVKNYDSGYYTNQCYTFDSNDGNCFLALYPRSSLGIKKGFRLLNTTGVIDYDYYNNPQNEGIIIVAFEVDTPVTLYPGDKFCQGVIHFCAINGGEIEPGATRQGGIGSTGSN